MDVRAVYLGRFFDKHKCPAFNYELIDDYINAADKYNLDYRILPAIAQLESQCGKRYPKGSFNIFGWNSARTGFTDFPTSVAFVSERLANGKYYAGKTLDKKLSAYCPSPTYPARIKALMNEINN